jgi:putative membrane protein
MNVQQLPLVNACLNGLSTALIVAGLVLIHQGRREWHKRCMLGAIAVSTAFLACYLFYHFNVVAVTRFTHAGWPRGVYFLILFTHIPLAFLTLPLLWLTVVPALKGEDERHRRWAKWTAPVWLYVSVTGVLVYLMLYVWFPAQATS